MNFSTELDIKRIQSLTDSIFAVAMAILILGITIPATLSPDATKDYLLHHTLKELFIYFVGFATLGIFWIGSHFQHHLLVQTDALSSWFSIFFLMMICVIPFSVSFLNNYRHDPISVIFYCGNLIVANLCHFCLLVYAWKKRLIQPNITYIYYNEAKQRILIPIYIYSGIIIIAFFSVHVAMCLLLVPVVLYIIPVKSKRVNASQAPWKL